MGRGWGERESKGKMRDLGRSLDIFRSRTPSPFTPATQARLSMLIELEVLMQRLTELTAICN